MTPAAAPPPVLRACLVTLLVWLPVAALAWLVLHALEESSTVPGPDPGGTTALRVGVFALVAFAASGSGALVAGRALLDGELREAPTVFGAAAVAPLTAAAVLVAGHVAVDGWERSLVLSLAAASVLGALTGAFLSTGQLSDEAPWARTPHGRAGTRGWRS